MLTSAAMHYLEAALRFVRRIRLIVSLALNIAFVVCFAVFIWYVFPVLRATAGLVRATRATISDARSLPTTATAIPERAVAAFPELLPTSETIGAAVTRSATFTHTHVRSLARHAGIHVP